MTSNEPRGIRTRAIPLPEARRLRRSLESLDTGMRVHSGSGAHPMGERGDAAQLLGMLKAVVNQVEEGLRGGPLQTDIQKGWFAVYDRDMPAMLAAHGTQMEGLAEFARQGITQVPHASQQMSVAATALLTASRAFAAAAYIAEGVDSDDFQADEVVKQSEAMYQAAELLVTYVVTKRSEREAEDQA